MAFDIQDILTPTSIGRIDHFLDDPNGMADYMSLEFNLEVKDQFGDVMKVQYGDEVPHLTLTQIDQLKAFMASRRVALPSDLNFTQGHMVGRCTWRFRDGDGSPGSRSLHVRVIELDGDGQYFLTHQVNDQPNLSPVQVSGALVFLSDQRTKADNQILP